MNATYLLCLAALAAPCWSWAGDAKPQLMGRTIFSGNSVLSSSALARALDYPAGEPWDEKRFQAALGRVREAYADVGRLRTRLDPSHAVDPGTGRFDARVEVREGSVVRMGPVEIEARVYYSASAVASTAVGRASATLPVRLSPGSLDDSAEFAGQVLLKPGDVFSSSRIRESVAAIKKVPFVEDVEVDINPMPDPDHVRLDIRVTEKSGRKLQMGDLRFTGHTVFSSTGLAKAVGKVAGLDLEKAIERVQGRLGELYDEKGRPGLMTAPQPVRIRKGRVDVECAIEEGPVMHVASIEVSASTPEREAALRRLVTIKPGDLFVPPRLGRMIEEFAKTSPVRPRISVDIDKDKSGDAVIKIVEQPAR